MVEITIRLNRKLNYKNRSTNTTFFICLVSGAIGSANARFDYLLKQKRIPCIGKTFSIIFRLEPTRVLGLKIARLEAGFAFLRA